MSTPSAASWLDFSGRRLELVPAGAYDAGGALACLEVHPDRPSHLRDLEQGYCCEACPEAGWHREPPAVWMEYAEQAAVGAEVGDWTITLCRECVARLADPEAAADLPDALVCFEVAGREYRDAEISGSCAARRMKQAQLDAAGMLVGALLAPVLAGLGCDRENRAARAG